MTVTVEQQDSPRTVVVLGVAYGGVHATATLARRLPPGWRVVAIDRNTHGNHVYTFPRYTIINKHAPKAFIPYTNVLKKGRVTPDVPAPENTNSDDPEASPSRHRLVHGIVTDLTRHSVTVLHANAEGNFDDVKDDASDAPADRVETIDFDYCVYALGSAMPAPCDIWGEFGRKQSPGRGTKVGGTSWLASYGEQIVNADKVLIVGGGALGIQFATDIKDRYPEKDVTLLHSRARLLPIYHSSVHDAATARLDALGVRTVLGERVMTWPENPGELDGKVKTVVTDKGNEYTADIVLACTGPKAHTSFIEAINKDTIAASGRIRVNPFMQVVASEAAAASAKPEDSADDVAEAVAKLALDSTAEDLSHIYAIGDVADTHAILAGHMSNAMGGVAARNILPLIEAGKGGKKEALEVYVPVGPKIKISLGLKHNVIASETDAVTSDQAVEDLMGKLMWNIYGATELGDDE